MKTTAFDAMFTDGLPRVPPDIAQTERLFGATCGPISLAAVFGTCVVEVMKFFPQFPHRDYTTQADMAYALRWTGADFERSTTSLPSTGVALLQLEGPWTAEGVPLKAQLPYTHWVASRNGFVFDTNVGDWLEVDEWQANGARSWCEQIEQCTGFRVRSGFLITPRCFQFSPFGRVPPRFQH